MRAWTRRSHRLAAALVLLAVVSSAPAWAASRVSEGKRPRPMKVAAGGESVVASQGSYCVVSRHSGMCADYAYPLRVEGRLSVAPGERVLLRTSDRAIHRAQVTLLHATRHDFHALGSSVTARQVPGRPRTLRLRLPHDVANANRLDIAATYAHHGGDSDWWAGIKLPPTP